MFPVKKMNSGNKTLKKTTLWLADTIVSLLIYDLAIHLRFGRMVKWPPPAQLSLVIIALASAVTGLLMDLNEGFMNRGAIQELKTAAQVSTVSTLCLIIVRYLVHSAHFLSRLATGYFFLLNIPAIFTERLLIKYTARKIVGREELQKHILIITDEKNLADVKKNFNSGYSYAVSDYVLLDQLQNEMSITRGVVHLPSDIVTKNFDDVFIYASSISRTNLDLLVRHFAEMGVSVHVALNQPEMMGEKITIDHFGGEYVCVNYSDVAYSSGALAVKRLFDIIGSLIGLALTGIIFIFVAPAIKLDSPGPVVFSQIRVGRNGRRFKFYKFRSMYVDAEEKKKDLEKQNKMSGLMFKVDDDPRVTKVGKFLRKTSLDEFPQFWNVLKGDMSLVGTRPPTEEEFLHYNEYYRKRLAFRPGITGLWQVSGRSDITNFDEVVKMDIRYIENWSLSKDFQILCKTILVVFSKKGAE